MPSPFDDFSKRAAAGFTGGTAEQRAARDLLRELMTSEGFSVNHDEWWHFDFKDWRSFRILDIPFEKLP
jgi:D-alanyl-D-alanine dipeptidase